jgi:hypothetical protein
MVVLTVLSVLIICLVALLLWRMEKIMATLADFESLLAAMAAETDRIAAKIQELINLISAGGLTAEQEEQVLSGLTSARDRLASLGLDPEDPIPPDPEL